MLNMQNAKELLKKTNSEKKGAENAMPNTAGLVVNLFPEIYII